MDWVSVALEEYRTLRTESLQAIEQMQRTLQIGVAAIGLITGFGIDSQTETAVAVLLLLGVAIAYQGHIHKVVSNKHTETCEALATSQAAPAGEAISTRLPSGSRT